MEKQAIISFLRLLIHRIENNECTGTEMEQLENSINEAINPLMTRDQLSKATGKPVSVIDNAISKKLPPKFKIRNIVLYPLNKIKEIL